MKRQPFFQNLIQIANRIFNHFFEFIKIKFSTDIVRIEDKFREVNASKQTASPCRQRFLGTGIHSGKGKTFVLTEQIPFFYPIPEKSSRFRHIPVIESQLCKDFSRFYFLFNHFAGFFSGVRQRPVIICFYRRHKVIRDFDRNVCFRNLCQIILYINKTQQVRMITVQ